jgi:hypothetical protein
VAVRGKGKATASGSQTGQSVRTMTQQQEEDAAQVSDDASSEQPRTPENIDREKELAKLRAENKQLLREAREMTLWKEKHKEMEQKLNYLLTLTPTAPPAEVKPVAAGRSSEAPEEWNGPRMSAIKLKHPKELTDGVDPAFEDWIFDVRAKLLGDQAAFVDEAHKLSYVVGLVQGTARGFLRPRLLPGCAQRFVEAEEVLEVLEQCLGKSEVTQQQEYRERWKRCYQREKPFAKFWAEYITLVGQLGKSTQDTEDLRDRLNLKLADRILTESFVDIFAMQRRLQEIEPRVHSMGWMKQREAIEAARRASFKTAPPMVGKSDLAKQQGAAKAPWRNDREVPRQGVRQFEPVQKAITSGQPKQWPAKPIGPPNVSGPVKAREPTKGTFVVSCYRCGGKGHMSKDCPTGINNLYAEEAEDEEPEEVSEQEESDGEEVEEVVDSGNESL